MSDTIAVPRALLMRKDLREGPLDVLLHLLACDTCWTTQGLYEHGFNRTAAQNALNELTGKDLYRRFNTETEDGDTLINVEVATTPGKFGPPVCLSRAFFAARDGLVMIGTSIVLRSRLRKLEDEGGPFTLIAEIQGGFGLVEKFCERFDHHRVEDKWFTDCPEIRDYIAGVSA